MTGLEFRCADVGVECRHVARADSEEALLSAVGKHAETAHSVRLNATLVDFALSRVRSTSKG